LKDAMTVFLRAENLEAVERMKLAICEIFEVWGEPVFVDPSDTEALVNLPDHPADSTLSPEKQKINSLYEKAMYLMYQAESPAHTKSLFRQHQDRFYDTFNLRLSKTNQTIKDLLHEKKVCANVTELNSLMQCTHTHTNSPLFCRWLMPRGSTQSSQSSSSISTW
jgi:hypothetical protein